MPRSATGDRSVVRLLVDPPLGGAVNMARDQAILQAVEVGDAPATLRLYRWAEPTISLGYFQRYDECAAAGEAMAGLAVVRRQTGGGAILHDGELTYSLTVPADDPIVVRCPTRLYEVAHDAIVATADEFGVRAWRKGGASSGASAQRGPFLCFSRAHPLDVFTEGGKLAGSAQRRTARAILQHGSLILRRHDEQASAALGVEDAEAVGKAFAQRLAIALDRAMVAASWTPAELAAAEVILADRYGNPQWTSRR